MPPVTPPPNDRDDAKKKRVRSLVYAAYTAFAIAFILLSIKSLVEGVFHPELAAPSPRGDGSG